MKIYTKTGDDGSTSLFGGERVGKDEPRVEAYGCVDELNAAIGLALTACRHQEIGDILRATQARLFELGADLASPHAVSSSPIRRIDAAAALEAEAWIDQLWPLLAPMRHFILPGGSELAARLHLARTICRRAERICIALNRIEPLGDHIRIYLNRLSDLLFVLARRANQLDDVADVPWQGQR